MSLKSEKRSQFFVALFLPPDVRVHVRETLSFDAVFATCSVLYARRLQFCYTHGHICSIAISFSFTSHRTNDFFLLVYLLNFTPIL